MASHDIYYYPYSSFKSGQGALLRVAALYFDRLYMLDPVQASWETIGPSFPAGDLSSLADAGILQRIEPAEVLEVHQESILRAIARDLQDPEFLRQCESHAGGDARWTLALGKLPHALQDELLKRFLKKASIQVSPTQGNGGRAREESPVYDEIRFDESTGIRRDYRYVDVPLAVGESIILNHALFGGLLHASATPLTDDAFHAAILAYKIARVRDDPRFLNLLGERERLQVHVARRAAFAALIDAELGVVPEGMAVARILEFRDGHGDELAEARGRLAWMARTIKADPWSDEFAAHVRHDLVPELQKGLEPAKRSWQEWLKVAGILASGVAGVASIAFGAEPLLSMTGAVAAMGAAGGATAGAVEIADALGKAPAQANGLHYLLKIRHA